MMIKECSKRCRKKVEVMSSRYSNNQEELPPYILAGRRALRCESHFGISDDLLNI
jgi:hypothetical protein